MAHLMADVAFSTVALTAAAAKTVAGVKAPANQCLKILEALVSHDGSTSSNAPDLTDFGRATFATNGPGTNSTSFTPNKKDPDRQQTVQSTAATNWTTEPTVITAYRSWNLAQYNGLYHHYQPFAAPLVVVGGQGMVLRSNSPNNVNMTGHLEWEE